MPETVTRRNLPHWYRPGYAHFVTYRLADSIPLEWLLDWRRDRLRHTNRRPPDNITASQYRCLVHRRFFAKYDRYLDEECPRRELTDDNVAAMIRENLYHHNGSKYELLAYCVMPNHVHVVFQPLEEAMSGDPLSIGDDVGSDERPDRESRLSQIMHSLKSYTANRANEILGRTGRFWQHESYDHWVRDAAELERIVEYVRWNPVKARLARRPQDWRCSSAHDRFAQDGTECGMVGSLRDDWRNPGR